MAIQESSREILLKTMGQGDENQLERTVFDQSAKAASTATSGQPNFASSLDEAIAGMKQAYSGIAKQKQKLMTEQTKLELRKELMSNPAIKELIAMRGELASKIQTSPTKIEGRADVNPLAQGRLQGGDIGALVQAMSDVSGDIQTRGTGILDVLNAEQKGRQQEYDIAKDQYDASRGMVSDIMGVGRYKMEEQLQPGKLTAQQLDNIAKNQEISGTKPLTPDQIINIYDSSNPQAIATYFAERGNEPKGTIPIIGGVAGQPATSGYKFTDQSKYTGKQHRAIDFRAQTPQPLSMPMDLTVVGEPVQGQQGGLTMRLKDAYGYTYTAMHLSDASKSKNGDTIPAGTPFAITGDSGEYVDGAHLHWEMRDPSGRLVDPTRTTSPAMTAIGKLMASAGTTGGKVLSVTDAEKLGVPYGTTDKQAMAMGINPNDIANASASSAAMAKIAPRLKTVTDALPRLITASAAINTEADKLSQFRKYGSGALLGTSKEAADLKTFNSLRASISRLTGEVGNLSEGEQKTVAEAFIPQWTDTKAQAEAKINAIKGFLSALQNSGSQEDAAMLVQDIASSAKVSPQGVINQFNQTPSVINYQGKNYSVDSNGDMTPI